MVELKTTIEELRSGKLGLTLNTGCNTTPEDILAHLERLAALEEGIKGGEILLAPCHKGDTVFWVDALNHICPIRVQDFTLGVKDDRNYHYSHFGSSIHLSQKEAERRVELNRMRACEECFKNSIRAGSSQVGTPCNQGRDCPKSVFKEKFAEQWRKEELDRMEQEDMATCRRCYLSHIQNGRREKLSIDCASCSGKRYADRYSVEWDEEMKKESLK